MVCCIVLNRSSTTQLKLPPASEAHARLWEVLDHGTRLIFLDRLVAIMAQTVEMGRVMTDYNVAMFPVYGP